MLMISVKVINKSTGKPVQGKRVSVMFDGVLRAGGTGDQYTDSQGDVHFSNEPGNGKVYVDGRVVEQGRISGRVIVYI